MIKVNSNNIHIEDSHKISKKEFKSILNELRSKYSDSTVLMNRSNSSLIFEWSFHNLLYYFNIQKSRTGSVDLDYPQKWYHILAYNVIGPIAFLLIS